MGFPACSSVAEKSVCEFVLMGNLEIFLFPVGVPSDADSSAASNKINGANSSKPNRPSLAKILLSLDGNLAKQQALSYILTALQIMYAR